MTSNLPDKFTPITLLRIERQDPEIDIYNVADVLSFMAREMLYMKQQLKALTKEKK